MRILSAKETTELMGEKVENLAYGLDSHVDAVPRHTDKMNSRGIM
jgi:hypothetical protein